MAIDIDFFLMLFTTFIYLKDSFQNIIENAFHSN